MVLGRYHALRSLFPHIARKRGDGRHRAGRAQVDESGSVGNLGCSGATGVGNDEVHLASASQKASGQQERHSLHASEVQVGKEQADASGKT